MNGLELFAQRRFAKGFNEGKTEERNRIIKLLAQQYLKDSNNNLTLEEAIEKAKKFIKDN